MIDANYWHNKWNTNDIFFHRLDAHPMLVRHFEQLNLQPGSRLFLPLCGKTLDIHWLLSKGYRVAGAELSSLAIDQLFAELGVKPEISRIGEIERYAAENIDIFVGDIFNLSRETLGAVNAIYDRAALVALPSEVRGRYADHLMEITDAAPQLLICFDYDQNTMAGPPFSIADNEVSSHYGAAYNVELLESTDVAGGLKGITAAMEKVWFLRRK